MLRGIWPLHHDVQNPLHVVHGRNILVPPLPGKILHILHQGGQGITAGGQGFVEIRNLAEQLIIPVVIRCSAGNLDYFDVFVTELLDDSGQPFIIHGHLPERYLQRQFMFPCIEPKIIRLSVLSAEFIKTPLRIIREPQRLSLFERRFPIYFQPTPAFAVNYGILLIAESQTVIARRLYPKRPSQGFPRALPGSTANVVNPGIIRICR